VALDTRGDADVSGRDGVAAATFPADPEELRASSLFNDAWYYRVELLPGVFTDGNYPLSIPMLPRLLMRRCDLRGTSCLDVGTMEGLTPVLMARGGASRVLAVDGTDHCVEKLAAVQHYYDVSFEYRTVGLMYSLSEKLQGQGFDLINCSGLLYHVFSPLMVLAGLRGALKPNGLMIVGTNVILDPGFHAEFNAGGAFQEEVNTFWYLSTGLLDYLLRYLRLAPIDCLYQPHEAMTGLPYMKTDRPSGAVSVLCRAVEAGLPATDDGWMAKSARDSWEYNWIPDWEQAHAHSASRISAKTSKMGLREDLGFSRLQRLRRQVPPVIDVTRAIEAGARVLQADTPSDSYALSLADVS
jgi:SAM-dependent methyltransferase